MRQNLKIIMSVAVFSLSFSIQALVLEAELFDYSLGIAGINDEITAYQAQLDTVNAQITVLQTAIGYTGLISPGLSALISQQTELTNIINDLQTVITELTTISNLDSTTKDQLYYFYTVLACDNVEFMVRMPFNYVSALADPVIQQLLADTTNTSNAKIAMAQLVFENYQISKDHQKSLVKLYRYLS